MIIELKHEIMRVMAKISFYWLIIKDPTLRKEINKIETRLSNMMKVIEWNKTIKPKTYPKKIYQELLDIVLDLTNLEDGKTIEITIIKHDLNKLIDNTKWEK